MTPTDIPQTGRTSEPPKFDREIYLATLTYLREGHLALLIQPADVLAMGLIAAPHQLSFGSTSIAVVIDGSHAEIGLVEVSLIAPLNDLPEDLDTLALDGYSALVYISPEDHDMFAEKLRQL